MPSVIDRWICSLRRTFSGMYALSLLSLQWQTGQSWVCYQNRFKLPRRQHACYHMVEVNVRARPDGCWGYVALEHLQPFLDWRLHSIVPNIASVCRQEHKVSTTRTNMPTSRWQGNITCSPTKQQRTQVDTKTGPEKHMVVKDQPTNVQMLRRHCMTVCLAQSVPNVFISVSVGRFLNKHSKFISCRDLRLEIATKCRTHVLTALQSHRGASPCAKQTVLENQVVRPGQVSQNTVLHVKPVAPTSDKTTSCSSTCSKQSLKRHWTVESGCEVSVCTPENKSVLSQMKGPQACHPVWAS